MPSTILTWGNILLLIFLVLRRKASVLNIANFICLWKTLFHKFLKWLRLKRPPPDTLLPCDVASVILSLPSFRQIYHYRLTFTASDNTNLSTFNECNLAKGSSNKAKFSQLHRSHTMFKLMSVSQKQRVFTLPSKHYITCWTHDDNLSANADIWVIIWAFSTRSDFSETALYLKILKRRYDC